MVQGEKSSDPAELGSSSMFSSYPMIFAMGFLAFEVVSCIGFPVFGTDCHQQE